MSESTGGDLVLEIPTDIHSISGAVDYVLSRCSSSEVSARKLNLNFRVGLTEALANAMMYGNDHDPSKSVVIEVVMGRDHVQATVRDQGSGFDPGLVPDPTLPENLTRSYGRGLFLMRELLDELWFNDCGNEVTLILRAESCSTFEGGASA